MRRRSGEMKAKKVQEIIISKSAKNNEKERYLEEPGVLSFFADLFIIFFTG